MTLVHIHANHIPSSHPCQLCTETNDSWQYSVHVLKIHKLEYKCQGRLATYLLDTYRPSEIRGALKSSKPVGGLGFRLCRPFRVTLRVNAVMIPISINVHQESPSQDTGFLKPTRRHDDRIDRPGLPNAET